MPPSWSHTGELRTVALQLRALAGLPAQES